MTAASKLPADVPPDFGYIVDAAQKKGTGTAHETCPERKAHYQHK